MAVVLAVAYLAYDVALSRGAVLPGGDLRALAVTVYVVLVLAIGSVVTYLVVPQPTGSGTVARRNRWSAALGFFAAVPIAYLVLVVAIQVIKPSGSLGGVRTAAAGRCRAAPLLERGCKHGWSIRTIPRYAAQVIITV